MLQSKSEIRYFYFLEVYNLYTYRQQTYLFKIENLSLNP